ncbi:MAG: divergent polysaccharide deacetylase family protein [Halieaceae bacterium]
MPSQLVAPGTTETTETQFNEPAARLVIIIDDLGHQLSNGRQAADLPGAITLSILPYTGHGDRIAKRGHRAGKEIMLHAPMSNLANQPLGAGGLTPELSEEEFRASLTASLQQIPHVQGVNNHMGSELTQYRLQMGWLMEELKANALYFVDSRTSSDTVAASVAQEYDLPHLSRQVFLDNEATREAIEERFNTAVLRAKKDGLAVAIGHPYKATLDFLAEALPTLSEQNIELVTVSAALPPVQPVAEPQDPAVEPVPETALATEAAVGQSLTSTPRSAM